MTINDKDIIFKIITHKKCQIKNMGKKSRCQVDNMILEMPTKLLNKMAELNSGKKFKLIRDLITQYQHVIDKNF